jgi:hypothetical protein
MTTIEREIPMTVPTVAPPAERVVFVTDDDRRSRRLRQAAAISAALALLWVAGLAIGVLGVGGLPRVSLPIPGVGEGERPGDRVREPVRAPQTAAENRAGSAGAVGDGSRAAVAGEEPTAQRARSSRRVSRAARPVGRRGGADGLPAVPRDAQPAPQPAAVHVTPPAQPAPQRVAPGLERRGLTLPPGQARNASEPQPEPPTEPPGQTRRRANPASGTTTTTTTTTTETPPGKDKPEKPPSPRG